jgi:predicted permease
MIREFIRRLSALRRGKQLGRELDEELRFHLEKQTEANAARGMAPEEARRQALVALGRMDKTREAYRDALGLRLLCDFAQDLRYALRQMRCSPGFTAVALISLSLGICAGTSFFSELNGTVLRDLPGVPQPDELVALQAPTSYPMYQRYRERNDLFSSTFAYLAPVPFGVSSGGGRTERAWGHLVTPSYFSTLGVRPALGRAFDPETEEPGQAPTVVISYRFWQNHFGSDRSVIGKTLRINGHPCTVIGVGPENFLGASPMLFVADLWMPLAVGGAVAPELADNALERRNLRWFQVVGRLKPGVTAARAEAELDTITRQLEQAYGEEDKTQKGRRVMLSAAGKVVPSRKQDLPLVMVLPMVVIGLLLLIACTNVANMMLARAANRRREIAVRLALGASRARLVRQLLTESMLVAAGAGVLGFILTVWLMHLLSKMKWPHPMPIRWETLPDERVLLFTLALTVFTGLAFGLAPALQATRTDLTPALKEGGNVQFRRYGPLSLRNMLVLYQVAASLTLLLLIGAIVLGFRWTTGVEIGFESRNLYLISLDPIRDGYSGEQATAFLQKLLERVKTLPSVTAASLTETVPMASGGRVTLSAAGPGAGDSPVIQTIRKYVVGKDYFDTTGIPILLGRGFRKEDETNDAPAVIVTDAFVRELWKGEDPLGRRIELGNDEAARRFQFLGGPSLDHRSGAMGKGRQVFEVVGVAKDAKMESAMERARPAIYFPLRPAYCAQPSLQGVTLMVRTAPGVNAINAVLREISAVDANITPFNARSMPEQMDQLMFPIQVGVWSYGLMGSFGLILASVGLAGVTAYSVAQRGHEIGIRMALGARNTDVLGLVMKEGAALVAAGTIIGLAGAWALTRVLAASLEPVARTASRATAEPLLIVGAPLLLAGLALAACYVPACRSLRIDPVVALRQD